MGKKAYYYMKMMEYKGAENTLENKLEVVNTNLRQCDDSFHNFPEVYNNNSDVEGQVIDDFNNKSEKFEKELSDILNKAKSSRDTIKEKKELAHERYLYYKELYESAAD